ncbi:YceI family protein [Malaciobacter marinus]|nr:MULTISPECIES: YceI family protein [Malaciobacter]AXX88500.1 YceI-like domain-containing periplasmic protein [Malaciobacter marinus]
MVKLVFTLILTSLIIFANAQDLKFINGEIKAHTEIFGDSNINPSTKNITSHLSIDKNIDSLKGIILLNTLSLHSNNQERDFSMYEVLNSSKFPRIFFKIISIKKLKKSYELKGFLTLNGIEKQLTTSAQIKQENEKLVLDGNFFIKLTSFNIQPPSLLFLKVRDKIDISYHLNYIKG